jgi:phage terminase Nu1 subunit (DNA packaging protein)
MTEKARKMKLKLDANGNVVTKDVNGNKLPVYVHDDGKEVEFDAAQTVSTISRLNAEAKAHREAKEAAEGKLSAFAGITDPKAAITAMNKLKDLDLTKLVDAGELDKVRSEVARVYEERLADATAQLQGLQDTLYEKEIGSVFANSAFVKKSLAIPADIVQARFGSNFGIEQGQIYAVDNSGNKIFSRVRPGELADPEEALSILVDQYPHKESILRGSGSSGSGSQGGSGGGGSKTITRAQWESLGVAEKAAAAREATIVD